MFTKEKIEIELRKTQERLKLVEQQVKEVNFEFIRDYTYAHKYLRGQIDMLENILEIN